MKSLKRLAATVVLISVLGLAAFAGETPTPPCAPPAPGETPTPPCATAQMTSDDSSAYGETSILPVANTVDVLSVAETALNLLLVL